MELPTYLCIAGPTASGKTAIALEVAKHWPVEIISVDSALVYRGMDIGTAKPSAQELAQVPHHLIDIREPYEPYSAADFVKDARRLIVDIHRRGYTPLLVGGTMLYFKALIDGIDDLPAATASVRLQIEAEASISGWPALHSRLAEVDPVSAQRIQPNDSQRVQRALEVWMVSGRPLSSFFKGKSKQPFPPLLSLEPEDRRWLHERIALRFQQMLGQGFIEEVRGLMRCGNLNADLPSMRAVGYRQAWGALQRLAGNGAQITAADEQMLKQELMQTGVAATRQLAKRQITWLRSMPERHVVHGDDASVLSKTLAWVQSYLGQPC